MMAIAEMLPEEFRGAYGQQPQQATAEKQAVATEPD